ncbi:hypothetical protein GT354_02240 [Streptomyces sp. SID3343]|nr:glycoside hydrolase family 3 N-terminal domain-containing protein [Streptomyces sp. SID3343]MYV97115.1 hypothetical protein [Streptomyces sp. SID3343]
MRTFGGCLDAAAYFEVVRLEDESDAFATQSRRLCLVVLTGLLRERFGFDGVVCSDFNVLTGMEVPGIVSLPPRNWGVAHLTLAEQVTLMLDAGVDQLGGETRTDLIIDVVRSGAVTEARIDESARRILRRQVPARPVRRPVHRPCPRRTRRREPGPRRPGPTRTAARARPTHRRAVRGHRASASVRRRRRRRSRGPVRHGGGSARGRGPDRRTRPRPLRVPRRVPGTALPRRIPRLPSDRTRAAARPVRDRPHGRRRLPRPRRDPHRTRGGRHDAHRRLRRGRRPVPGRRLRHAPDRRHPAVRPALVDDGGRRRPRGRPLRHPGAAVPLRPSEPAELNAPSIAPPEPVRRFPRGPARP